MPTQQLLTVTTRGRGVHDVTAPVEAAVRHSGVAIGLANVFLRHTSASLVLLENADPDVQHDLEQWFARHVPDGDPAYRHRLEGPDDMPAHIRSALTASSLTIPIRDGRLALGTWQGIALYEHRHRPHQRTLVITIL